MGWPELLEELNSRRKQLDDRTESFYALAARYHHRIYCTQGCSNCCALMVNCSFSEALAIALTLTPSQRLAVQAKIPVLKDISRRAKSSTEFLRLFRNQLGGCPLLNHENGCCSIYPLRPFSCRALLSTRNSSWCAVDFSGLHPLEKEAFLSSLDPELVAFPTHYLAASRDLGEELEAQTIAAMQQTFGIALSGTLIFQIWLELTYRLSEVMGQGAPATLAFINKNDLDLPYLLQWYQPSASS